MPRIVSQSGAPRLHAGIVRLLVAAKANPNIADRQGATSLQHARGRGYREIAALLEKAGGR